MRPAPIPLRPRHRVRGGEGRPSPRLEDGQRQPFKLVVHNVAVFGRPILTNILTSTPPRLPSVRCSGRIPRRRNSARPLDRRLSGPRPSLPVFRGLTASGTHRPRTRLVTSLRASRSGLGVMGGPQLVRMRPPCSRRPRTTIILRALSAPRNLPKCP